MNHYGDRQKINSCCFTELSRLGIGLRVVAAGCVGKDLYVSGVGPEAHRAVPEEKVAAARMHRAQWYVIPYVIAATRRPAGGGAWGTLQETGLVDGIANRCGVINR